LEGDGRAYVKIGVPSQHLPREAKENQKFLVKVAVMWSKKIIIIITPARERFISSLEIPDRLLSPTHPPIQWVLVFLRG
jgi:hypothetical protein